jgi:predicted transcriptional regulator
MRPRYGALIGVFAALHTKDSVNITKLSKNCDVSYSYISRVLLQYEKKGLVTREKNFRITNIKLTEKGKELANACYIINTYL